MVTQPPTLADHESKLDRRNFKGLADQKKAAGKATRNNSATFTRDQTTKGKFNAASGTLAENGAIIDADDSQHTDVYLSNAARAAQKAEAPNRWSKALGSISQPLPTAAQTFPVPKPPAMAPGPPANKQASKATHQQPGSKVLSQQQQPQRPGGKPAPGSLQDKESSATGNVRLVPRNNNSPSNPPRRTSSGGGSNLGGSSARQPHGETAAQQQSNSSRNWAGIVSQRPQAPSPRQQPQQQKLAAPPPQPTVSKEPFPPLSADAAGSEPVASPVRPWPAPPSAPVQTTDTAAGAKASKEQSAASALPAAGPAHTAAPSAAKPAPTTTDAASIQRVVPPAPAAPVGKVADNKQQGSSASSQWIPKQQLQQQTPLSQPPQPTTTPAGSAVVAPAQVAQFPKGSKGGRSAGTGHRGPNNSLQDVGNSSNNAGHGDNTHVSSVPAAPPVAPVDLPPIPSNALASKAVSAAAAAAAAAVAGVGAATAAMAAQQPQHKAVNLPSSQEVNTAAMSDFASNRTAASGSSHVMGYRVTGAAATPAPPPAASGFVSFGAGFVPSAYQDNYHADGFGAPDAGYSNSNYSSHLQQPAAAAPSGSPAPSAGFTGVVDAPAARPAGASGELSSSNRSSDGGTYRPPFLAEQDQAIFTDQGRSSSSFGAPKRTSSSSSTGSVPAASRLSADAPAFQLPKATLVPTQVHTASGNGSTNSSKQPSAERGGGGVLTSSQLEQQWLASTRAPEAANPAISPATLANSSSNASPPAAAGSWATQLRELADKIEHDSIARDEAAAQAADKLKQLQQQLDGARAAQSAAEAKASGLGTDLDAERKKVQAFEIQSIAERNRAATESERADALAAELAGAHQVRDAAAVDAAQQIRALQQQVADQQMALADLENRLRQWQDKYNSTEADNRGLRDMLGPRAPAPGTLIATTPTAAQAGGAGGSFEAASVAAAPVAPAAPAQRPAGKVPPPGFGPAAATAQPAAPAPTAAAEALHMKNEHELVSTLLSMLHASPHAAMFWGDAETAGLNVQLLPLNWATHYSRQYGTISAFMQQRPAVFGQRPDGAFYKVPGAEEMVKKAMAEEEEQRARETAAAAAEQAALEQAAATAPWRVPQFGADLGSNGAASGPSSFEGWSGQQQQHAVAGVPVSTVFPPSSFGMGMSMPFMPHPHLMMAQGASGLPPPASMPLAPPSVPGGHGMQHQPHHAHSRW